MKINIDLTKEKNMFNNWLERKHAEIFSKWDWNKSIRQNYNESRFVDRLIVDLYRKHFRLSDLKKKVD